MRRAHGSSLSPVRLAMQAGGFCSLDAASPACLEAALLDTAADGGLVTPW